MRTEISNQTIALKEYKTADVRLLCEAARESAGGEFTRWMPWCHEYYSMEEAAQFAAYSVAAWENQTEYNFGIFDAGNNEFLGGIGLNQFNREQKLANLGYWVRTSRRNRGIASQAARLLSRAGFEDLDLNRIEIVVAAENQPSQKTAEKAGAMREGILRNRLIIGGRIHDAWMFSFIREDFARRDLSLKIE